jgi:putative heme-binding domain-containing protein
MELAALVAALDRLEGDRPSYEARERVARLLEQTVPEAFGFVFGKDGYRPQPTGTARWKQWLRQKYPKSAAELAEFPHDLNWLDDQLESVDWSQGDAVRGGELFQRKGCNQCHGNRGALGPDLIGVTERFSLRDLFTAIAFPSLNVSPRYQTTVLETNDGQIYQGAVVYDSVDGVTLVTSANRTIRVDAQGIAERLTSPLSLMPNGLLDGFTPRDYADLMSYLKTLDK